jgi:hypothetical protein
MGVVLRGFNDLVASLKNTAERSSAGVRQALGEGAKEIQELAIKYAPVDEGNLENSIKVDNPVDVESRHGRKMYMVYVDLDQPAKDGKVVGDYAEKMHEDFSYDLGPKSAAKEAALGVMVGPKFLERAVDETMPKIEAAAQAGLLKGVGK